MNGSISNFRIIFFHSFSFCSNLSPPSPLLNVPRFDITHFIYWLRWENSQKIFFHTRLNQHAIHSFFKESRLCYFQLKIYKISASVQFLPFWDQIIKNLFISSWRSKMMSFFVVITQFVNKPKSTTGTSCQHDFDKNSAKMIVWGFLDILNFVLKCQWKLD